MKKWLSGLMAFLLIMSLGGCKEVNKETKLVKKQQHHIVFATDLHYLAASLKDNGTFFMDYVSNSDGKLMPYVEEVTETFIQEMLALNPEYVILSGDLTYNGEKQSHIDLAKHLNKLEQSGIEVLVIPGNHDLNNSYAAKFEGECYEMVDSVDAKEFVEIYQSFGYDQSMTFDEASHSYVYDAGDIRFLMIDTNSYAYNEVLDETLSWIENQLKKAQEDEIRIISVSHQNLYIHNGLFSFGYSIRNAEKLQTLFEKYNVLCHFSGHMHMQHLIEEAVPEVASSSLMVTPHQYGLVHMDGEQFHYETKVLDFYKVGYEDIPAYSSAFFNAKSIRELEADFKKRGMNDEQIKHLVDAFIGLNTQYFTGDMINQEPYKEGIALWKKQAGTFYLPYIRSIIEEEPKNHHILQLSY